MRRVHCMGVLVVDALSGPLSRYPEPRIQPQVVTESVRFMPGGGAANTGLALARMGVPVAVFSRVGDDLNGQFLCHELEVAGVDVSGVRAAAEDTTPFTFVAIHADGERTFIHTPGANQHFGVGDLDLDRLFDTDILLYQDLWVLPQLDGTRGAAVLAEARRRGIVTLLDECWGLGPDRETFEIMLPHCDYVLPSLDDLAAIYPDHSPEQMCRHLLACGATTVVLKMGADGCLVACDRDRLRVPALPVQPVDTTGAGDCWNAGFIAGLLHGKTAATAARIGNACAAYSLEAVGGATGIPAYDRIEQRAGVVPPEPGTPS